MNPYENHFGTTFGDLHSFRDFGLYPRSKPVITAPEVQVSEIEVPGRDGKIDTTEALDGQPHYFNREGTFEFTCIGRGRWAGAYHKLKNYLHGRVKSIILDEEPQWKYTGRLTVAEPEYDSDTGEAFFTVEANLDPWKLSTKSTLEDWQWDPFSFFTDIIRNYHHIQINTSPCDAHVGKYIIPARTIRKKRLTKESATAAGTRWQTRRYTDELVVYGSSMPAVPDIILLAGSLSVTYPSTDGTTKTISLVSGSNEDRMSDFVISSLDPVKLKFQGAGVIQIAIDLGSL